MVKFNSDLSLYGPSSFTLLYPDKTGAVYTATIPRGTWKVFQPNYPRPLQDNTILDAIMFFRKYSSEESDVDLPDYGEV